MSRILAIDYGTVRTGLAVTDQLQIIATALQTVETRKLMSFLKDYISCEDVSNVVIGLPVRMHGEVGVLEHSIQEFIKKFKTEFPQIKIHRENEAFTSKMASQVILQSGKGKKKRQDKSLIDKVSATIILQSFLGHQN